MKYIDHTLSPLLDVHLPPAIILPAPTLVILYLAVLSFDFCLLHNERHLNKLITPKQLRIAIAFFHTIIPMVFISNHPPANILFAAMPWFIASYSAHMSTEHLTLESWTTQLVNVCIDNNEKGQSKTEIRYKGISKIALAIFKLACMHLFIDPLLPQHGEYALEYAWLHPYSLFYTALYGLKAYFLLGAIDLIMGIEQALFAWNLIDLFDSPIISSSPRDFWSRRWNKIVRNLLHSQVFTANSNRPKEVDTIQSDLTEKPMQNISFWSSRPGRGLLAFIISGIFHELIIMSVCRRITLENFVFFTLQGFAVMIEVALRQGAFKQEPRGGTRILCIALQFLFMTITGRLFTAPFLRSEFFIADE